MSEERFHREDERLDEVYRRALGNMRTEPSGGVWGRINRTLLKGEILRFNFTNLPRVIWALVPLAVITTGMLLYFGVDPGDTTREPLQPVAPISSLKSATETVNTTLLSSSATGVDNLATSVVAPKPVVAAPEPVVAAPEPVVAAPEPLVIALQPSLAVRSATRDNATASVVMRNSPRIDRISSIDAHLQISGVLFPVEILAGAAMGSPPPIISISKPVQRGLDLGVNITPDMIFYQNAVGSFKYNYTFDLAAKYRMGRFSVQSGVGMTYSTSIGNYAISYLKNDSIGFYYEIQSYNIDPGNPSSGIIFDTKKVTVYDSVHYSYDYATKNRYFYLQIPLTFGYRVVEKPRWSLSVDAGMFYAYLFSLHEPAPTFYVPESRVMEVQRLTPTRNRHTVGLSGGLSVEYRFARNFFVLIEPTFKYYLQAVEESSTEGVRQPFSMGLRAGIWYRLTFKPKTK